MDDKALTETLNKAIVALRSKLFVALLGKPVKDGLGTVGGV